MQLNTHIWNIPGTSRANRSEPAQAPLGSPSERSQPFVNPDVFRPAFPTGPDGVPDFPQLPKWIPSPSGGPEIEIPFEFPMEIPERSPSDGFIALPNVPHEIPDWSQSPWRFPQPIGPEIVTPKQFPATVDPNGVWLLS